MTPAEKSINRSLPHLRRLRNLFASSEESNKPQILCAWADFSPDPEQELCSGIYIYGVGETLPDRHVFGGRHCVLITTCILPWMRGDITRYQCVAAIADQAIKYYSYATQGK